MEDSKNRAINTGEAANSSAPENKKFAVPIVISFLILISIIGIAIGYTIRGFKELKIQQELTLIKGELSFTQDQLTISQGKLERAEEDLENAKEKNNALLSELLTARSDSASTKTEEAYDPEDFKTFTSEPNFDTAYKIAMCSDAPELVLCQIAMCMSVFCDSAVSQNTIATALLTNPNASTSVLMHLLYNVKDTSLYPYLASSNFNDEISLRILAQAIASHSYSSTTALATIECARNPKASEETLNVLLGIPNPDVKKIIQERLNNMQ